MSKMFTNVVNNKTIYVEGKKILKIQMDVLDPSENSSKNGDAMATTQPTPTGRNNSIQDRRSSRMPHGRTRRS
jgi:hypothetical protein